MFKRLLSLGVLAALAACAGAPELERPALPVPDAWPQAGTGVGAASAQVDWRHFFPDPALQSLIATALEHNRDVRIAAARVLEARAQYGISRADRLPSLNLTGSGAFVTAPAEVVGAGQPTTSERYDLGVSLAAYELDFWGRLANLGEAARFNLLASDEARRAVQLALVGDVAGAYFGYLQALEGIELAQAQLELRGQSLALVGKGVAAGGAYDLQYQQAAALLENARSGVAAAEHQKNLALNRIQFLLGHGLPELPAPGSLGDQGLDVQLAPGLPSEVLLARPDVIAAENRLRAAHANVAAARAAFLPKIVLTATAGLASQGLASLFSGAAWAFQPSVSLPLFDGGRNAASADLAAARRVIAVADYEKTIQQAFREVADLLSARATLARQLQSAQANRRAQGRLLEIASARHGIGLISYLEVLEAQRNFLAASEPIVQLQRAQMDSAAQLYKALGGGGLT